MLQLIPKDFSSILIITNTIKTKNIQIKMSIELTLAIGYLN